MVIDWSMSAALENVRRSGQVVAEVTNLAGAVREWLSLPSHMQEAAELTPEHPIQMTDEGPTVVFRGRAIAGLADRLPAPQG